MSKSEGKNIGIKFTEDITTADVSFNAPAFKVTGKEYQYVYGPDNNGPLLDKEYQIDKIERYGVVPIWDLGEELRLDGYSINSNAYITPQTLSNGVSSASTIGFHFTPTENMILTHFRVSTPASSATVGLWEVSTNHLLATKTSSVGSGWVDIALDTPVNLLGGIKYAIGLNCGNPYSRYSGSVSQSNYSNYIQYNGHYRTYSLNSMPADSTTTLIVGLDFIFKIANYESLDVFYSNSIQHTGQYRVRWQEDKPTGTDITIEYATGQTQGEWAEASNGDVITSDTNLWFKVTLETIDTSVTPTLQDLWIEEPEGPQDKIRIVIDDYSRFASVIGNIMVSYDTSIGNLAGAGGAVESFTESFTPTELVPIFNPNAPDHLTITSNFALAVKEVVYSSAKLDEPADQICILPASMSLTTTHVGTLPL